MSGIVVDSNVLLDVITEDPVWFHWSSEMLARKAETSQLVINPVIFAEVSVRYSRIEDLDTVLPRDIVSREPLPYKAAFLAGKIFSRHRKREGGRRVPLPDLFIGAHAAVMNYALLTRNAGDYRKDFPSLEIIAP